MYFSYLTPVTPFPPPLPLLSSHACTLTELSKYGDAVDRTCHTSGDVTRDTGQEESPPLLPLALLTEFLQVQQLSDVATPTGQQDLVHAPVERRGPPLETRVVTRHGAEVFPDPLQDLVGLFHTTQPRRTHLDKSLDLCVVAVRHELTVGLEESTPDDQDVAEPGLSVALPLEGFEDPFKLDAAGLEVFEARPHDIFPGTFVHPGPKIDEHAAAHHPSTLDRAVDAQNVGVGSASRGGPGDVLDRGAVVEPLGLLVPKVPQTVPLGRRLGVEVPGVVVDDAGTFLVDVLLEHLAAEQGRVPLEVERGVHGDPDPRLDLGIRRGGDHGGCLTVQEAQFVVGTVGAPGVEAGRRVVLVEG